MVEIRARTDADGGWLRDLLDRGWGGEVQIFREREHRPAELPGLIAVDEGERVGVLSYTIEGPVGWIVLLEALRRRRGIGGALVAAFLDLARAAGCDEARVVTTNDNRTAQAFYVSRGFALVETRIGAVTRERAARKPSIPQVGEDGTPITDELEYAFRLS